MTLSSIEEQVIYKYNQGYELSYEEKLILRNVVERIKKEEKQAKSAKWWNIAGLVTGTLVGSLLNIDFDDF